MKTLFNTLSKITNIICQLVLIAGAFWLIKSQGNRPLPVDYYASSAREERSEEASRRMSMKSAPSIMMSDAQASEVKPRAKIIKNGQISLEVSDLKKAKDQITGWLPEFKAYIQNENEGKTTESWNASLTIKVPAENFDGLLNKIADAGFNVENKSVNLSDVTEQYIDLEARLKNKKLLIEKYTALLRQSQKVADTIEINRQLESVGSELESLEGQMKYLNHQIDLSSLDVSLVKRLVPTEKNKSFFEDFKYELNAGINALRSAFLFVIGLWPFLILAVLAYFIYRRFRKP